MPNQSDELLKGVAALAGGAGGVAGAAGAPQGPGGASAALALLSPEERRRLLATMAAQRLLADQTPQDPIVDPQQARQPFRGDLRQLAQTRAQGVPFIQLGAPPTKAERTAERIAAGSASLTNILTALNKRRRASEAKASASATLKGGQ